MVANRELTSGLSTQSFQDSENIDESFEIQQLNYLCQQLGAGYDCH